jgi:hypothetical protein
MDRRVNRVRRRAAFWTVMHVRTSMLPVPTAAYRRQGRSGSQYPHQAAVLQVRLKIQPNLSSPCNVEQYELQYRPAAGGGDWQSTGCVLACTSSYSPAL